MSLAIQLLHQIANPALTHNERARLRCQLAKHLEDTGNYEAAQGAMGELWRSVGYRPILHELDQTTAAEMLLRVGVLTGWIGSVKQIEGAQETAKDLISESTTMFEALQDTEKIAEAQMELGYCYWREGAFDEARVLLKEALSRLAYKAGDIKAITLLRSAAVEKVSNRLNDALQLLIEAAPLFDASSNYTLKGRFHNEYAQVLRKLGTAERRDDYIDQALIEYAAASFHFEHAGHTRYQACVENNLGFLFGTIKNFSEAHEHLDRAQALFTSLKDKVHIAQVDETRAKVLLAEGRIAEAEKLARSAMRILEVGGEQSLFAEALTTHGIALARMNRRQHAQLTIQNAVEVAQNAGDSEGAGLAALTIIEELGEYLTVDDLSITYERAADLLITSRNLDNKDRLLSCAHRLLFLVGAFSGPRTWKNFSLKDALRRYEARIIERALKDAGKSVSRAAHMLGFKNHTSLIKKLNKWHRHLLSERAPAKSRKSSLMFLHDADKETRPIKILHVEDNQAVADAVKEMLETEGWKVETFAEGTDALRMLASEEHYDVLLFDISLPGLNGIDLIGQTRRLSHRQQTPIIVLSASDYEVEARRAGANAFLSKPNDVLAIAETIARLLARKPRHISEGK